MSILVTGGAEFIGQEVIKQLLTSGYHVVTTSLFMERIFLTYMILSRVFDFSASHWVSLRTMNSIESSCSTVKLMARLIRDIGNQKTAAATMIFKLLQECEKSG